MNCLLDWREVVEEESARSFADGGGFLIYVLVVVVAMMSMRSYIEFSGSVVEIGEGCVVR